MTICLVAGLLAATTGLAQQPEKKAELPIRRIVLFSSGVGYFQHNGQVDGDAVARLDFRTGQINDILKSLVLMDTGGGSIASVSYASREPIERKLQSFEVNVIGNPSMFELLKQLRGAAVEVEAPNKIAGTILGVESHTRKVMPSGDLVTEQSVNLLTPMGIKSIQLGSIVNLTFTDPTLRAELQKALAALAEARDKGRKPITIRFAGQGQRGVHVSYVIETPVWKTSYRLVLPDKDDDKPMLQGWAIVENTTENDWSDVQLSLVSGRPVSFVMDLYTPLYAPRPEVQPELYAGLVAPVYNEGMAEDQQLAKLRSESKKGKQLAESARGHGGDRRALAQNARKEAEARAPGRAKALQKRKDEKLNLASGVSSAASAQKLGALFSYNIQTPVTIGRQKSAMLPIVQDNVTVDAVSVYNRSVQAKHPLSGAYLSNTTGAHLMGGPVTVFESNMYAGDSRIDDMPTGDKRLLSWAVDLDVTVDPSYDRTSDTITAVKINRGVLHATHKYVSTRTYAIKNKAEKAKTLLIEHPFKGNGWELVTPKDFEEKTGSVYRFRVPVEANQSGKFDVVEQRVTSQTIALLNSDRNTLLYYAGLKVADAEVKKALQKAAELRQSIAEAAGSLNNARRRLQSNRREQERVLKFVKGLKEGSQIHQQYQKDLQELKTKADELEAEVDRLDREHEKLQRELRDYLEGLSIE